MGFKTHSIRAWAKEWRQSDWRETIPLSSGRECPDCLATICGGKSWREHARREAEDAELFNQLVQAVRVIATALEKQGIVTVRVDGGEDQDDAAPVGGVVIGSGPLPEEMRGGGKLWAISGTGKSAPKRWKWNSPRSGQRRKSRTGWEEWMTAEVGYAAAGEEYVALAERRDREGRGG